MEGRSTAGSEIKTDEKITNLTEKSKKKSIFCSIASLYEKAIGNNNKTRFFKSLEKIIVTCNQKGFISSEEQKMIGNIINIDLFLKCGLISRLFRFHIHFC